MLKNYLMRKWSMDLKTELEKRYNVFNKYWQKYLPEGEPVDLYNAARHVTLGGGKRLRPCIAMLACESVFGNVESAMPFAAALEMIHNFTLVHDDIMDKSDMRRNLPTVHIKFGEPTAILTGDFLFAKSFEAIHDLSVDLSTYKELEHSLVKCVLDICEGQQLDIQFEQRKMVTEEEYINMVHKKTAVLFELAARGGAIIGGGNQNEINAFTEYGIHLGLSFQIWDDYLDLSSNEKTLGKDIGNDIRNGKKTLIAVYSMQNATGENRKLLDEVFGNRNALDDDIKRVFTLFREMGSVDYARNTALNYTKKAKETLEILRDSEAKEILKGLADYSIQREK
ncbi:geranylgeranyl pyrophosphate synthase [Thermoplasmatales archaeon SCGC AB-540-F20]|nr:geranylgeranyl pyrophosphate synthase [Thermoplasmatales archaeon SCGC AB-540-F20]